MSTEIVHGPTPEFKTPLGGGRYSARIEGHYTLVDGVTAAGVTDVTFASDRPAKRRNELLGLRSAFFHWFLLMWVAEGGAFDDGVRQLREYRFRGDP